MRTAALLVAAGLPACTPAPERPGTPPHHVLLVTVEGLRADHVSAYLYPRRTTWFEVDPLAREHGRARSIDDLAEEGVLFHSAFAPAGDVDVALASLHEGRWPLERGPRPPTIAAALADEGVQTAAFLSRPRGPLPPQLALGFDAVDEAPDDLGALAAFVRFVSTCDWGDGRGRFLWLHLTTPSAPFEPPRFPHLYYGDEVDYAALFEDSVAAAPTGAATELVARYDGEIAFTNYLLWYALEMLDYFGRTEDVWRDTALVFAGIGGVELERPGVPPGSAGLARDSSLRVPLLLRHPASLTGRRILAPPVELVDLGPTVLEWFGARARPHSRGRSLFGLTDRRPRAPFEERAVCAVAAGGEPLSARGPRWRLVVDAEAFAAGERERAQLFESVADPAELRDVAAAHPSEVARLWSALEAWTRAQESAP